MLKIALIACGWLVGLALFLAALIWSYTQFHPTFGGKPDAQSLAKIEQSPHFNGEVFENFEPIPPRVSKPGQKSPNLLDWILSVSNPPEGKQPSEPLPTVALNAHAMQNGDFAWLGHSTALMKLSDRFVLTDPVFYRASPVFLGGKPFAMQTEIQIEDLPEIDAVLISHDHYDHLDYKAIKKLNGKVKQFYVPLGVKAHLQRWGVADDKIHELDWGESRTLGDLTFTFVPSRHYGGRHFNTRAKTLWGGWIVQNPDAKVYFSGDSGYGKHFAQIGEQYGPFDVAFMENGAYNENWADNHMFPEQSAQALADVGAKVAVPIHWAKFDLAYHTWKEPIERLLVASESYSYQVATPKIGEVFSLQNITQEKWWRAAQ